MWSWEILFNLKQSVFIYVFLFAFFSWNAAFRKHFLATSVSLGVDVGDVDELLVLISAFSRQKMKEQRSKRINASSQSVACRALNSTNPVMLLTIASKEVKNRRPVFNRLCLRRISAPEIKIIELHVVELTFYYFSSLALFSSFWYVAKRIIDTL